MKNKKIYFEGWYFKNQFQGKSIAFIPGINIDKYGGRYAFIQVITENNSYNIKYDYEDFSIEEEKLIIKIRDNIFSKQGIILNIIGQGIEIKGSIRYEDLTPIKYDIMGPFSKIPFMECSHGIISMHHKIDGMIEINGEEFFIKNGIGYIEKDSGRSFPKSYLWVHSNDFKQKLSIMVSIADIPFMKFSFKGLIAIVHYKGREYRFATYNGAKIINYNENGLSIRKGKYRLVIMVNSKNANELLAPSNGEMVRTIYESISCNATFKFFIGNKKVFDLESLNTSFEYVK